MRPSEFLLAIRWRGVAVLLAIIVFLLVFGAVVRSVLNS